MRVTCSRGSGAVLSVSRDLRDHKSSVAGAIGCRGLTVTARSHTSGDECGCLLNREHLPSVVPPTRLSARMSKWNLILEVCEGLRYYFGAARKLVLTRAGRRSGGNC